MKDREAREKIERLEERLKITEDTFRDYMRVNNEFTSLLARKIEKDEAKK